MAAAITFDDISPDPGKHASAILNGGLDQLKQSHEALIAALATAQGLDQFLTSTLGAGGTISFETLQKVLNEIISGLKSYLEDGSPQPTSPENGETGKVGGSGTMQIHGQVRSRNDVVRMIDTICSYYEQVEPSSPVPLLLKRAKILAKMGFVEAMQELNLATIDTLKTFGGSAVEMPPSPPETPPPAESPSES